MATLTNGVSVLLSTVNVLEQVNSPDIVIKRHLGFHNEGVSQFCSDVLEMVCVIHGDGQDDGWSRFGMGAGRRAPGGSNGNMEYNTCIKVTGESWLNVSFNIGNWTLGYGVWHWNLHGINCVNLSLEWEFLERTLNLGTRYTVLQEN